MAREEIESTYAQRSLLFHNRGDGRFEEVGESAGVGRALVGRSAAFADYDDDGDIDVFVTHMNGRPALFENDTVSPTRWVGFHLVGRRAARDAFGARVTLVTNGGRQIREIRSGASYLSQSDPRLFFGLGESDAVERVEVRWPGGSVQELRPAGVDRYWLVVEELSSSSR